MKHNVHGVNLHKIYENVRKKLQKIQDVNDQMVLDIIEDTVFGMSEINILNMDERRNIIMSIFNRFRRYGELQPLLDDKQITEIMVNGYDTIFVEKNGRLIKSKVCFESKQRLESVIQRIVADIDRKVNRSSPIVDARLDDGSRVHIVLPPIALDGAVVTIRKFTCANLNMDYLLQMNCLNNDMANYLKKAVKTRKNILICGGTGSGKTTFLNMLSDFIPKDERIITIEDSAELQINGIDNLIRMETRDKSFSDDNQVSIRDLIRAALRMRPDRIVVGEVRGSEALDMLQAMNTGHKGSITTGHSNSSKDMIYRLETMILSGYVKMPLYAIRSQIARGIDIIIYMKRYKNGQRKVVSIDTLADELVEGDILITNKYYYDDVEGIFKR